MRSFTLKAALAAIVVSTSLGGAFAAASPGASSDGREVPDPILSATPGYADADHNAVGDMTARPAMAGNAKTAWVAPAKVGYRPRLASVVGELGTANHRIRVDRKDGYLSRVEFRKLRNEERNIRQVAFAVASRHGGALPAKAYGNLQAQIRDLNRNIYTYAHA